MNVKKLHLSLLEMGSMAILAALIVFDKNATSSAILSFNYMNLLLCIYGVIAYKDSAIGRVNIIFLTIGFLLLFVSLGATASNNVCYLVAKYGSIIWFIRSMCNMVFLIKADKCS